MSKIYKVVLLGFLSMLLALMAFFPQGNITGANAFLGGKNPGMVYWLSACFVLIIIPVICFFVIKYKCSDEVSST